MARPRRLSRAVPIVDGRPAARRDKPELTDRSTRRWCVPVVRGGRRLNEFAAAGEGVGNKRWLDGWPIPLPCFQVVSGVSKQASRWGAVWSEPKAADAQGAAGGFCCLGAVNSSTYGGLWRSRHASEIIRRSCSLGSRPGLSRRGVSMEPFAGPRRRIRTHKRHRYDGIPRGGDLGAYAAPYASQGGRQVQVPMPTIWFGSRSPRTVLQDNLMLDSPEGD